MMLLSRQVEDATCQSRCNGPAKRVPQGSPQNFFTLHVIIFRGSRVHCCWLAYFSNLQSYLKKKIEVIMSSWGYFLETSTFGLTAWVTSFFSTILQVGPEDTMCVNCTNHRAPCPFLNCLILAFSVIMKVSSGMAECCSGHCTSRSVVSKS